jgi:hypothetical protein
VWHLEYAFRSHGKCIWCLKHEIRGCGKRPDIPGMASVTADLANDIRNMVAVVADNDFRPQNRVPAVAESVFDIRNMVSAAAEIDFDMRNTKSAVTDTVFCTAARNPQLRTVFWTSPA